MKFIKICKTGDIRKGEGKVIEADGITLAVFNDNGCFYAINNACPHGKGPLGEGVLDDGVVACPWHGWRFNVKTGKCTTMPVSVKTYSVKVEGGDILVEL